MWVPLRLAWNRFSESGVVVGNDPFVGQFAFHKQPDCPVPQCDLARLAIFRVHPMTVEFIKSRTSPSRNANSGIDGDTANAVDLATFLDRPLHTADGKSINIVYNGFASDLTQGTAVSKSIAEGFRVFESMLKGQQLSISGVSLDEEAVNMVGYQRAYQASARLIRIINELLGTLVGL